MTVDVNVPVASVVPVAGDSVTLPVPAAVSVTVWPDSATPEALLTTTDSVVVDPPTTSDEAPDDTVTVVPAMRIGICVDLPLAVAVIVAVRVVAFETPDENVTVALPVESLLTELAVRKPVSAENVTGTPDTAAFDASVTTAVIVVVVLLSDATLVDDAPRLMAAAVGTGTGVAAVGELLELLPPPPHAVSRLSSDTANSSERCDVNRVSMGTCEGWVGTAIEPPRDAFQSVGDARLFVSN